MTDDRVEDDEGGESACYAHLICPECATVLDGAVHRDGCTWMDSENRVEMTHDVDSGPAD